MKKDVCPFCDSTNLGIGYQLGNGRLFVDPYAYHSSSSSSDIEVMLCKDCGCIIRQRVLHPEIFSQFNEFREEELLELLNQKGLLLCNENKNIPSIVEYGYSMENMVSLINRRQAVYSKVYKNQATFLSVKVYQLLKRCLKGKKLTDTAEQIYEEIRLYPSFDKGEVRSRLGMEKKEFDQGFDLLLQNLKVTAISARKLNHNWYSYFYITDSVWESEVEGLHFSGNPREALELILQGTLSNEQFDSLFK